MLIHYKILDLANSTDAELVALHATSLLSPVVANGAPAPLVKILSTESATKLRAATIHACQLIVATARDLAVTTRASAGEMNEEEAARISVWEEMDERSLDGYLWSVGKTGGLRELERLSERCGSLFY